MNSSDQDARGLIESLVLGISEVVGDGASTTMFHHGAREEGRRLAERHEGDTLPAVIGEVESILSQKCELVEDDDDYLVVRIWSPPFAHMERRPIQAVVEGLFEGAIGEYKKKRYRGTIVTPPKGGATEFLVELREEKVNGSESQAPRLKK